MNRPRCMHLLFTGLLSSLCRGNVSLDLQTAVLTLDDKGCAASLKFADGNERSAAGTAAFRLETDRGHRLPQTASLAGDRLRIVFAGGVEVDFTVTRHPGFAVFELKKLTTKEEVRRFGLLSLPVADEGQVADTLNACTIGPHTICVMATQPNVHAFTGTVGTYRADLKGCRHEFVRTDKDKRVGACAARFTATSTLNETSGWSVRGRTFREPLDLSGCKSIRAWVRGDGKGELLKIQLYDGAGGYRDNYLKIDFEGWRQVSLTECPINSLRYDHVTDINLYYNGLPPRQTVTCLIDQVEAVLDRQGKERVVLLEDFESAGSPIWGKPGISLNVETLKRHGIEPAGFGLIACPKDQFLDTIRRFEQAAGLPSPRPGGEWNKVSPWVKRSYFFLTSFKESQFDEALAIARRGGFHTILLGQESWCSSTGHYGVNRKSFPDGLEGLKRTVRRFNDAGFRVGLHFLGASIYPPDTYLTPIPDQRLVKGAFTTLATDIDEKAGFVPTASAPDAFPAEDGGYMGDGAVLQIGDELVAYGRRSTSPPFGFAECRRGHLGTRPASHKKDQRVAHLVRSYGYHMYDMDTSLLDEVATNFAKVANACNIDMLYFDGSERLQGDHWYYNARLHKTFYDKLKNKDMLIQASSYSHYSWHIMARTASADGHGDLKGYLDQRSGWFEALARNHMPLDIGWYYGYDPTATPDMFEYVLGATIGYDSSMSFQVSVDAARHHPFTPQILDLIARYERLRLSGRVPQAMRDRLRIDPALRDVMDPVKGPGLLDKRREYRLLGSEGDEAFQRVMYETWHEVAGIDGRSNEWTVKIPAGPAKVGLQVHAAGGPWLQAGPAYRAADALVLESFDDLAAYTHTPKAKTGIFIIEPGMAGAVSAGVSQRFESSEKGAREGTRCGVYTATNSSENPGGWSVIGKVFDPPIDLSWHKGIGFWLRGDGKGGSFKLQIRDTGPGVIDYYVANDFTGWRYQQLARPEKDPLDYGKVRQLLFYYNGLPPGTTVSCGLDDVRALRSLDHRKQVHPCLQIAGRRLDFDGSLAEGQFVTLWPDEAIMRNRPGLAEPVLAAGKAPTLELPAGQYPVRFTCDGALLMTCRVRLTFRPPERCSVGQ
jgi:hypothetical protein